MAGAHDFIAFFETLQPGSLEHLADHFADDAHFVDPFNDVRGLTEIRRVFEHMFSTCHEPRFRVDETIGDGDVLYLRWRFVYGRADARRTVHGVSRLCFAPNVGARSTINRLANSENRGSCQQTACWVSPWTSKHCSGDCHRWSARSSWPAFGANSRMPRSPSWSADLPARYTGVTSERWQS